MEGLEDVKKELEAKRQEIARELQSAKDSIGSLEGDLRRVDDALAALTGKKAKARSRAKKPAPTVDELREQIASIRADDPFAEADEVEEAVRAGVKKNGKSLTGFGDLYARASALVGDPGPTKPTQPSREQSLPSGPSAVFGRGTELGTSSSPPDQRW